MIINAEHAILLYMNYIGSHFNLNGTAETTGNHSTIGGSGG
jgi:hypothetical protein